MAGRRDVAAPLSIGGIVTTLTRFAAIAALALAVPAAAQPPALAAPWLVPSTTIILPPSAALPRARPTPPVCLACLPTDPGKPGRVPGPCMGFECSPQPRITPPWLIGPLPPTVTR
jgi:hypothetical protein